jgi:NTE family protein
MAKKIAIACQGGGSHTAFTGGALSAILTEYYKPSGTMTDIQIIGLSGTSGGAICALLAWNSLLEHELEKASTTPGEKQQHRAQRDRLHKALENFWLDPFPHGSAAVLPSDFLFNQWVIGTLKLPLEFKVNPYLVEYTLSHTPWIGSTPLRNWASAKAALHHLLEEHVDFPVLRQGCATLRTQARPCPELYVGAVSVKKGDFVRFKGTDPQFGIECVLASATLPEFMIAQTVPGYPDDIFWDGLFSQNPPLMAFLDGKSADEKPDEIWIIRINPKTRKLEPMSEKNIDDRRNELSGNLSLEQEIKNIDGYNNLIQNHAAALANSGLKIIKVRDEITISDHLSDDLDYGSKLRRDRPFLKTLFDDGYAQAHNIAP